MLKRANYLLFGSFVHTSVETQWYLRITEKNMGKLKFKKSC